MMSHSSRVDSDESEAKISHLPSQPTSNQPLAQSDTVPSGVPVVPHADQSPSSSSLSPGELDTAFSSPSVGGEVMDSTVLEKFHLLHSHSNTTKAKQNGEESRNDTHSKRNRRQSKSKSKSRSNSNRRQEEVEEDELEEVDESKQSSSKHLNVNPKSVKFAPGGPSPLTPSSSSSPSSVRRSSSPVSSTHRLDLSSRASDNATITRNREDSEKGSSLPVARYDTFGETQRIDHAALLKNLSHLPTWLRRNGFDDSSILTKFDSHATIDSIMAMTKQELKKSIGVKDGIRLYNLLREVETAQRKRQSRDTSPSSRRNERVADIGVGVAGGESFVPRELCQPGLYGFCSIGSCHLPAPARCANKNCDHTLCLEHTNKTLLSGTTLCPDHYQNMTHMTNIQDSIGITSLKDQGYNVDCVIQ